MAEVIPALWIGSAEFASEQLHRFTHILNMAANVYLGDSDIPSTVHYLHVRLDDIDDISPYLDSIYEFVDGGVKTGGNVLIHCQQGVNRSAAACIAYLGKHERLSVAEAVCMLRTASPACNPGIWFQVQVSKWLGQPLSGDISEFKTRLQQRKSKDLKA